MKSICFFMKMSWKLLINAPLKRHTKGEVIRPKKTWITNGMSATIKENIPLKKVITSNHQFTFLRIHWGLSRILKTSNKSVWSNVFWYANVYIFSKFNWCTIHWDKKQMLKKFLSDEIDVTKMHSFFLLWAPTHHSFTYNSQFLYELKHMVYLSKTMRGILHFRFRLVFIIKLYLFV